MAGKAVWFSRAEKLFLRIPEDLRQDVMKFLLQFAPDLKAEIIREYERVRKQMSRTIPGQVPGHFPDSVPDSVPEKRREDVRDNTSKRTKVINNSQGLDYTSGFRSFWSIYPRREGKGSAFLSWKRSGCEVVSEVVVRAVREQLPHLLREGGKFRPLPATWLNQRRWEDEPFRSDSEADSMRAPMPDPTPLSDAEHAEVQTQIRGIVKQLAEQRTP